MYKKSWLEGKEELLALVRLDWSRAEPILQAHAAGDEPRRAAEARSILFEHAVKNKDADKATLLQKQLQAAVADKRALPEVRDIACRGLMSVDWPGRDEWYLSLFSDATLQELHNDVYVMRPLSEPVKADPDKWIPVVTKLVGGKNRAAHDNAVACLIQFHLEDARKDALGH